MSYKLKLSEAQMSGFVNYFAKITHLSLSKIKYQRMAKLKFSSINSIGLIRFRLIDHLDNLLYLNIFLLNLIIFYKVKKFLFKINIKFNSSTHFLFHLLW